MTPEFGDEVSWVSQAGGYEKRKVGIFIGVINRREYAWKGLDVTKLSGSQLKGQDRSLIDRALVKVPRSGKSEKVDYYTPRLSALVVVRKEGKL